MNLIASGAYLRALREARGMSQEALAEAIGVSGNTIYRIESGRQEPMGGQLTRLLKLLGGHIDDLAALIERQATADDGTHMAIERLKRYAARLPEAERRATAARLRQMADDLESEW